MKSKTINFQRHYLGVSRRIDTEVRSFAEPHCTLEYGIRDVNHEVDVSTLKKYAMILRLTYLLIFVLNLNSDLNEVRCRSKLTGFGEAIETPLG